MPARLLLSAPARSAALASIMLSLSLVGHAFAAVESIGSVNPVPPVTGGTFSGALVVGDDQAADPDLRAWVNLDGGTALQYGSLIIGDEEEFLGVVNVLGDFLSGVNTRLTLSSVGSAGTPAVQVGLDGTGFLNIHGGATMNLSSAQGDMSIGHNLMGVGYVTVADPFTMLTVSEDFFIGRAGMGHLEVLDGAIVQTTATSTSHAITIGADASGIGTVVVDGRGSVLRAGSLLVVGSLGAGTLTIGDQAIVDADNVTNATVTVGLRGRVNLAGGTLIGQTPVIGIGTTVNGILGGSGLVRGSVAFNADSSLEVGAGDLLRFSGNVFNQGSATIDRGEVQFLASFANHPPVVSPTLPAGRITLEDGTVRFLQSLTTSNAGVISSARGTNNVHGEIANSGTIVVASETVATFHDAVTNTGTINVLPRGNALFLANLIFTAPSALLLGVGMHDLTDTSAQLGVAGAVSLGGSLTVSLDGNFTPVLGQTFDLITSGGGISGIFNSVSVPSIPGPLDFQIVYNPASVQMVVVPGVGSGLLGDYNGDFAVDAADYVVWRKTDGTPDGFNTWRSHFGETAGSGATAGLPSSAIPEPSSALLFILCLPLFLGRHSP